METRPLTGQARGLIGVLRVVVLVLFGVVALAVIGALATYPSWQLAVAAACAAAFVPALYLTQKHAAAHPPLQPGVTARTYLVTVALALLCIALLVVTGLMFSIAPVD